MTSTISEYSRTNTQEEIEEEENCLVATKQFRRLSKRQKAILEALKLHDCMNSAEIADYCKIEETKGTKGSDLFPAMAPEEHKAFLKSWNCDMCPKHPEDFRWKLMSSIYRTMRELEKRDLVARLVGRKPAVWTWVDWSTGNPRLGMKYENRHVNPDNKFWENGVWKSGHYRWGEKTSLSSRELKRNIKYYDGLTYKALSKASHYKVEARKRGLLVDDKWIDE
jgi:hypothetical protein